MAVRALTALAFAAVWLIPWQAGHDVLRHPISNLVAGPTWWVMTLAFVGFGTYAVVALRGVDRLVGLGLVAVGFVPAPLSLELHAALAWPTFGLMVVAAWQRSPWAGILAAVMAVATVVGGPLVGLVERTLFGIWLVCVVAPPDFWQVERERAWRPWG